MGKITEVQIFTLDRPPALPVYRFYVRKSLSKELNFNFI